VDFLKNIWKKIDIGQDNSKHLYTFLNNPGKLLFSIKVGTFFGEENIMFKESA
jgi:hypothetical protein